MKRAALKLPEVIPSNPDDSDDDFPFPDIKPLEKTSPPINDKQDVRNDRLTAIIESPRQASNDSGVAMMATPSTEQLQPPTLSKNYSNADTLQLNTPSQQDGKLQTHNQGIRNSLFQKQDKGMPKGVGHVNQELPSQPKG